MACFEQGSEVNAFLKTLEVHSVLYDQRKYVVKRKFLAFIKVSWRKTTKCAFEIDFLPCARPIQYASTQRFNLSYADCSLLRVFE